MRFVVASPTGLCFGVRRAIDKLEEALRAHGHIYSLGSPIHNPQEVARLAEMGLCLISDASEVPTGEVAFVRAHGISRAELTQLRERASEVVDGTCPFVQRAQERAETLAREGYKVVILGDREHPEVKGIVGHIDVEPTVVKSADEITDRVRGRVGILSQTTQQERSLSELVSKLVLQAGEIKVYNTICRATIERQEAVRSLSSQVEGIVIIGGRNSANTKKLVEIVDSLGADPLWIEHPDEFDRRWSAGKRTIGVAAGGSTPDWLINDLTAKLQKL